MCHCAVAEDRQVTCAIAAYASRSMQSLFTEISTDLVVTWEMRQELLPVPVRFGCRSEGVVRNDL